MLIAQFAKKYELDKRTIDFYTTEGLLDPPEEERGSKKYRIYGKKEEAAIKKIVLLRDLDIPVKEIKKILKDPSYFTEEKWDEIIQKLEEKKKREVRYYDERISLAKALRDTKSKTLSMMDRLNESQWKEFTLGFARGFRLARGENVDGIDPEIVDEIYEKVLFFWKRMKDNMSKGIDPESEEIQLITTKFLRRLVNEHFGSIVYYEWLVNKDNSAELFEDEEMSEEEIKAFKEILEIIFEWCGDVKEFDNCIDFPKFEDRKKEQLLEIYYRYAKEDDSTDDAEDEIKAATDLLREICLIPKQINAEVFSEFAESIKNAIEIYLEIAELMDEDRETAKDVMRYIYHALKKFFDTPDNKILSDEQVLKLTSSED